MSDAAQNGRRPIRRLPFHPSGCSIVLRAVLTALLAVLAAGLYAWALDPSKAITQYAHDTWTSETGLPQNSVNTLLQTSDGYLWFGTQEGLVRFDGLRFTVFDRENTRAFKSAAIRSLVESPKGGLWIGTRGAGVVRYEDGKFRAYTAADGLPSEGVVPLGLMLDSQGILWIRTEKGLASLRDGKGRLYGPAQGLQGSNVRSMAEGADGEIWVGTDEGLYRFQGDRFNRLKISDGLCDNNVRAILPVKGDGLWVITDGGINAVRQDSQLTCVFRESLGAYTILTAIRDRFGTLWMASQKGLLRFSDGKLRVYTTADGLSSNFLLTLLEDRDGILWIGTRGGGLNRFARGVFSHIGSAEGYGRDRVLVIYEDREGSLWFGISNGGLHRLKDGKFTIFGKQEGLSHDLVLSVYEDRSGAVWVGTDNGLNRLQHAQCRSYFEEDGLSNQTVQSVLEDRSGNLWVGTWRGLDCMRGGSFVDFPHKKDMATDFVSALFEDREGALWVATVGHGLKRLKGGDLKVYTTKDGLAHDKVRALLQDSKGNLWISSNGGLDLFVNGKFKHYTTADGLASNLVCALYEDPEGILWVGMMDGGLSFFWRGKIVSITSREGLFTDGIFSILEDGRGNLWMTSNKGVLRISKVEAKEFAEGKRKRVNCVAYGLADGMRNFECNGGLQPCAWKARDGGFWFASTKGAVFLRPGPIPSNILPPPVVIESVSTDGRPLNTAQIRELPAGTKEIEFRYTALSLLWPEKVRFRYILKGYQEDWVDVPAGRDRIATFANLPPGRYTFRVAACNNDGVWNEEGATWTFDLKPRYYQTLWFLILCLLGAALLVAAGHKLRVRALQTRQRELTRLVQERTRDLEDARLAAEAAQRAQEEARLQAESANSAKSHFLANMSHELRTPMNSIIGFSEVLEDQHFGALTPKQSEHVSNILSSARHLLSLINDILDLAKVEAGHMELEPTPFLPKDLLLSAMTMVRERAYKQGIHLVVETGQGAEGIVEGDERKIKQVLFNLLGNAIKFTPRGKSVTLSGRMAIDDEEGRAGAWLLLAVEDTGIGIRQEDLPRLFKPFIQLESAYTKQYEGTGLGLALCRKLVELQGGCIEVKSEFGKGSRFMVAIPVRVIG